MLKLRYLLILLLLSTGIHAQRRLYQSHWQNRADYDVAVVLDPAKHLLHGHADIVYHNNSLDTLREIYFHLWPNAYKDRNTALAKQLLASGNVKFHYAHDSLRGYMDSVSFRVDGKPALNTPSDRAQQLKKQYGDEVVLVMLPQGLAPGKKITISTAFRVKIPGVFSRMGREDGFYAITQWYPKPAVYDANGWHPMVYLNQGEFYSEFGRYDVKIKVPQGWGLASTGAEYAVPDKPEWKGYRRFVQDSIHDFAWFTSAELKSITKTITLPSGRKVACTLYDEKDPSPQGTDMIASAVEFYSRRVGEYPYSVCKAVVGPLKAGGGMEYPTITIVDKLDDRVILHEVGHNWFYGILASDERTYPWMDEGVNSYYESKFYDEDTLPEKYLPKDRYTLRRLFTDAESKESAHLFYRKLAGEHLDQAAGLPAAEYSEANYGAIVYGKTSLLFDYLADYLGEAMFTRCMQTYYKKYAFRHPLPADMKLVFEETSGRDLSWFFDHLIKTEGSPDIKIKKVMMENDTLAIVETASEGVRVPFVITTFDRRGKLLSRTWFDTAGPDQRVVMPKGAVKLVVDGFELMPEVNRRNNYFYKNQLFGRLKQPSLKFLGGPENPGKTRIFLMPVLAYNNYNKLMAGLSIYNSLIPRRNFEYALTPMYSFKTGTLTGLGNIQINSYPFRPNSKFNKLEIGADFQSFRIDVVGEKADYIRSSPYLNFRYKAAKGAFYGNYLQLRYTNLNISRVGGGDYLYYPLRNFVELANYTTKKHALYPNSSEFRMEYAPDENNTKGFLKISGTFEQRIRLGRKNKFFDVRAFAGAFAMSDDELPGTYQFRLSGMTGAFDYNFRNLFIGRTDINGLFAHQIMDRDGFFKSPAGFGSSANWLAALNLRTSLPGIIPFRLFFDVGTYANAKDDSPEFGTTIHYNGGLLFSLAEDVIEIYVPVIQSRDIKEYYTQNFDRDDKIAFHRRISFLFNIDKLRPVKAVREIRGL